MSASDYPQPDTIHVKWVGYFAALWVLLIALAEIKSVRALVIAFVWLMAIAALFLLLDPNNPYGSLLQKVGLGG